MHFHYDRASCLKVRLLLFAIVMSSGCRYSSLQYWRRTAANKALPIGRSTCFVSYKFFTIKVHFDLVLKGICTYMFPPAVNWHNCRNSWKWTRWRNCKMQEIWESMVTKEIHLEATKLLRCEAHYFGIYQTLYKGFLHPHWSHQPWCCD